MYVNQLQGLQNVYTSIRVQLLMDRSAYHMPNPNACPTLSDIKHLHLHLYLLYVFELHDVIHPNRILLLIVDNSNVSISYVRFQIT